MREVRFFNMLKPTHVYTLSLRDGNTLYRLVFHDYLSKSSELVFVDMNDVLANIIKINKADVCIATDLGYGDEVAVPDVPMHEFKQGELYRVLRYDGITHDKVLFVDELDGALCFLDTKIVCEVASSPLSLYATNAKEPFVYINAINISKVWLYE